MSVKKITRLLIFVLLLLVVAGCTSEIDTQLYESVMEGIDDEYINVDDDTQDSKLIEEYPKTEYEIEDGVSDDEFIAMMDSQARFTSAWAKTEDYFFFTHSHFAVESVDGNFALYRLPLDDIGNGERVDIPSEGYIEIVGIDGQYLFVSRSGGEEGTWRVRHNDIYRIYRVSLDTLEAVLIDEGIYYGVPFFHLASNSIFFARVNVDERTFWLESLQLDTNERHVFYRLDNFELGNGMGWWQAEQDAVVFINSAWVAAEPNSDFILIDAEFNATQIQLDDISGTFMDAFQPLQPQNLAEKFIHELPPRASGDWSFVTIDEWVYYLWSEDDWYGNLYRINIDGTQNTLLQEGDFSRLYSINDSLFAMVFMEEGETSVWYEALKLAEDGSTLKVLGGGWSGFNGVFTIQHLVNTDILMLMHLSVWLIDGWVAGLYCTETGALFSIPTM